MTLLLVGRSASTVRRSGRAARAIPDVIGCHGQGVLERGPHGESGGAAGIGLAAKDLKDAATNGSSAWKYSSEGGEGVWA